ncbi:hypothetical protein Cpir12675_003007 [Ceratocystis pirilliformis]|uniref:Uncharacterized protein n=1 Tax=Ceratocystis pirilliformis TaxID=259994 RepID=A0ABR3Z6S9_9PEZI
MSYYDNGSQWSGAPGPQGPSPSATGAANAPPNSSGNNSNSNSNNNSANNGSAASASNWDHQASQARAPRWKSGTETTDVSLTKPSGGVAGPTAADEFAFSYQFDEVDRAHENLAKSGKIFAMGPRREFSAANPISGFGPSIRPRPDGRLPPMPGVRPNSINDGPDRALQTSFQNFYSPQRHQSPRGPNETEQALQTKRKMAAQRERELRNLHTEQQFQRNTMSDSPFNNKPRTDEEARELIARQRSALYGEGAFAEKTAYVDETGAVHSGAPSIVGPSVAGSTGPASLRGASPMTPFDPRNIPSSVVIPADSISVTDSSIAPIATPTSAEMPLNSLSPQPGATSKALFDNPPRSGSVSSPIGSSPARGDSGSAIKPLSVAPIGTRPSGTSANVTATTKPATTPISSPGGWGRGGGSAVWGQSSGLGAQASVWG